MHQGHRDRPVISCGVLRGHGLTAGGDGHRGIVPRGIFRRLPTDRTLLGSHSHRPPPGDRILLGDDGMLLAARERETRDTVRLLG